MVRPLFLDDAWQLLEEFSGHCKAERLVSRTRKQSPRPPASAQAAEIIDQTCAKLDALELNHGVIQSGKDKKLRPLADIQVASGLTPTLASHV